MVAPIAQKTTKILLTGKASKTIARGILREYEQAQTILRQNGLLSQVGADIKLKTNMRGEDYVSVRLRDEQDKLGGKNAMRVRKSGETVVDYLKDVLDKASHEIDITGKMYKTAPAKFKAYREAIAKPENTEVLGNLPENVKVEFKRQGWFTTPKFWTWGHKKAVVTIPTEAGKPPIKHTVWKPRGTAIPYGETEGGIGAFVGQSYKYADVLHENLLSQQGKVSGRGIQKEAQAWHQQAKANVVAHEQRLPQIVAENPQDPDLVPALIDQAHRKYNRQLNTTANDFSDYLQGLSQNPERFVQGRNGIPLQQHTDAADDLVARKYTKYSERGAIAKNNTLQSLHQPPQPPRQPVINSQSADGGGLRQPLETALLNEEALQNMPLGDLFQHLKTNPQLREELQTQNPGFRALLRPLEIAVEHDEALRNTTLKEHFKDFLPDTGRAENTGLRSLERQSSGQPLKKLQPNLDQTVEMVDSNGVQRRYHFTEDEMQQAGGEQTLFGNGANRRSLSSQLEHQDSEIRTFDRPTNGQLGHEQAGREANGSQQQSLKKQVSFQNGHDSFQAADLNGSAPSFISGSSQANSQFAPSSPSSREELQRRFDALKLQPSDGSAEQFARPLVSENPPRVGIPSAKATIVADGTDAPNLVFDSASGAHRLESDMKQQPTVMTHRAPGETSSLRSSNGERHPDLSNDPTGQQFSGKPAFQGAESQSSTRFVLGEDTNVPFTKLHFDPNSTARRVSVNTSSTPVNPVKPNKQEIAAFNRLGQTLKETKARQQEVQANLAQIRDAELQLEGLTQKVKSLEQLHAQLVPTVQPQAATEIQQVWRGSVIRNKTEKPLQNFRSNNQTLTGINETAIPALENRMRDLFQQHEEIKQELNKITETFQQNPAAINEVPPNIAERFRQLDQRKQQIQEEYNQVRAKKHQAQEAVLEAQKVQAGLRQYVAQRVVPARSGALESARVAPSTSPLTQESSQKSLASNNGSVSAQQLSPKRPLLKTETSQSSVKAPEGSTQGLNTSQPKELDQQRDRAGSSSLEEEKSQTLPSQTQKYTSFRARTNSQNPVVASPENGNGGAAVGQVESGAASDLNNAAHLTRPVIPAEKRRNPSVNGNGQAPTLATTASVEGNGALQQVSQQQNAQVAHSSSASLPQNQSSVVGAQQQPKSSAKQNPVKTAFRTVKGWFGGNTANSKL